MSVFDEIEESERQQKSDEGVMELIQELISNTENMGAINENLQKFVSVCESLKRQQDKASIDALEEIKASGKANVQEVENILSKYSKSINLSEDYYHTFNAELKRLVSEVERVRNEGIKTSIKDEGNKISRFLNKKFYWLLGIAALLFLISGVCSGWLVWQNVKVYQERVRIEQKYAELDEMRNFSIWYHRDYSAVFKKDYKKTMEIYQKIKKRKK